MNTKKAKSYTDRKTDEFLRTCSKRVLQAECIPPKSIIWSPNPKYLRMWLYWKTVTEVTELKWLVSLYKERKFGPIAGRRMHRWRPRWGQGESGQLHAWEAGWREAPEGIRPADTQILGFWPSSLWANPFLLIPKHYQKHECAFKYE